MSSQSVRMTEKGIWVIEETNKYPEHERTDAYIAICEDRYEQWQQDRLAVLDAETLDTDD